MLTYGDRAEIAQRQAQGWTASEIADEFEAPEELRHEIAAFVAAREDDEPRYQIVRFYANRGQEIVASGLTLEAAQAHCKNPETSSHSATGADAVARTERVGVWFDGYEEM